MLREQIKEITSHLSTINQKCKNIKECLDDGDFGDLYKDLERIGSLATLAQEKLTPFEDAIARSWPISDQATDITAYLQVTYDTDGAYVWVYRNAEEATSTSVQELFSVKVGIFDNRGEVLVWPASPGANVDDDPLRLYPVEQIEEGGGEPC